jgi:hypothetical protein
MEKKNLRSSLPLALLMGKPIPKMMGIRLSNSNRVPKPVENLRVGKAKRFIDRHPASEKAKRSMKEKTSWRYSKERTVDEMPPSGSPVLAK